MPLIDKITKPKTRRGKRFLENRGPKLIENFKTTLFVRGSTASAIAMQAMKDLNSLKKPHAVFFSRKNDIRPFEDSAPLEVFCKKNDASLYTFASHNKKRPHNLVFGRMFNFHTLDMAEMGIENFTALSEFKVPKIPVGTKPMLLFAGESFEEEPEYQRLKNLFIDFFRGMEVDQIRLQGLEHVIMFTAVEGRVYFRSYRLLMKKSGSRVPRIELEEIGPRMDLVLRRTKLASEDLFRQARKQPIQLKLKKKKNIKRDSLGTTRGRIHMQRQDFGRLQTRKMKGLKKSPAEKKAFKAAKESQRLKMEANKRRKAGSSVAET